MDLYIECPVCEQQFSTPHGPPEQQVACPSCSRKFELGSAVEVSPPNQSEIAVPKFKPRLEVPAAFAAPVPTTDQTDLPAAVTEVDAQPVKKKPILALQRKRRLRRRLITTLVSSALLAAAIGILGGLLIQQLKQNPLSREGTSITGLGDPVNEASGSEPDSEPQQTINDQPSSRSTEHAVADQQEPIPPEDIPPQSFDYLDRKASQDRWNSVQPHLVSLRVFDGLGTHDAVGTIVDSRGWVLTSYHAVAGASKIEVKASVHSIDDYWEAEPLTDLVRGYVAEQKENDLVLLSINRRFVVAFSVIEPAVKNNVVESEYLLQCAPPSRENLYGGSETKIAKRADFGSLDKAGQSFANRMQLGGADLVWLVATGTTVPLPGTPLFKIDGDLAAINVFNASQHHYFLPVERVKSLLEHADDNVKPLTELGISLVEPGPIAVSPSSDMYQPSVRLNQLTESCKVFNWIPQTREDYEVLQDFVGAYVTIEKYAREKTGSTIVEEKKIVEQIDQLGNLIRERAASLSIEDESRLSQMNKDFARRDLQEANQYVPFYGEVHSVDIVNAQLILKLVGTESYVKAPFVPSDHPMRMQTRWVFFSKTPETTRRVNYRISPSELVTAETIVQLFNFGER